MKIQNIQCENTENYEIHRIACANHENYENQIINNENDVMKFLIFQVRIWKIMKI